MAHARLEMSAGRETNGAMPAGTAPFFESGHEVGQGGGVKSMAAPLTS